MAREGILPQTWVDGGLAATSGWANPTQIQLTGSYVRLSAEPKPTAADGAKDGDDLLLVDTKEVYIFYKGTWYLQ